MGDKVMFLGAHEIVRNEDVDARYVIKTLHHGAGGGTMYVFKDWDKLIAFQERFVDYEELNPGWPCMPRFVKNYLPARKKPKARNAALDKLDEYLFVCYSVAKDDIIRLKSSGLNNYFPIVEL